MTRLVVAIAVSLIPWICPTPAPSQDLGDLFRRVSPSVVVIRVKGRDVSARGGVTEFSQVGSGVLVTADGKVMTAAHVVLGLDEIAVEFLGGQTVGAKVVSAEVAADLSLLQLERVPADARVAPMGDSRNVNVGEQVIVVGAPYGLAHSLSVGWISAKWPANTVYPVFPLAEFLQTTATINTGNSGGPMFNAAGKVIGIVSHNISKGGGSEGLGFVVSINSARQLLLERRSFFSGVDGILIDGDVAEILNVPQPTGYLVKTVARGSPAWEAGVQGADRIAKISGQELPVHGDIVLTVAGIPIGPETFLQIRAHLSSLKSGETFKATLLRAGKIIEISVRIP